MFEIIFRSVLEIFLLLATAMFWLKASGYWKYIRNIYIRNEKDIPTYKCIQLLSYVGIVIIGIWDVCDNFIKIIQLF